MLRGEMTGLRARHDSDIPILHAELYDDVATRVRADSRPWHPIPPGSGSPYRVTGPDDHAACFSVIELVPRQATFAPLTIWRSRSSQPWLSYQMTRGGSAAGVHRPLAR